MTGQAARTRVLEPDRAKDMLASLIEQAVRTACTSPSAFPQGLRVEVPVAYTDALAWLRAQAADVRVYWASREDLVQVAGAGTADAISPDNGDLQSAFAELQRDLASAHPNLRYYGGMAFDPVRETAGEWMPFGAYRFFLPRFQIENHGTHSYLVCNVLLRSSRDCDAHAEDVLEGLDALSFPENPPADSPPPPRDRADLPGLNGWNALVEDAMQHIQQGNLEKVVLARKSVFTYDAPLDALALFERIAARASAAYEFYIQPEPGAAFFGATPERLYRRQGRYVESDAMASTRPRGDTESQDATFAQALLESAKDRHEHACVSRAIQIALEGLCHSVYASPDVTVLKLPQCQHLFCTIEGILREEVSDAAVMRALHPTPAVGGAPTGPALRFLREHESFDRGWYAGPVGWLGPDSAEFAVGIRSGLVRGNILSLYSGAGIVEGSTPDDEWNEIDTKLSNALSALNRSDD